MDEERVRLELVLLRNTLFRGRRAMDVCRALQRLRTEVEESEALMRNTWLMAIDNAINKLKRDDCLEAGYELNFVHNLPLSPADLEKWDEEYFFEFELPEYLERSDSADARKAIEVLGADLSELDDE